MIDFFPFEYFFLSVGLFQVNFSYAEAGEQKQALVKFVACKRLVHYLFASVCFLVGLLLVCLALFLE